MYQTGADGRWGDNWGIVVQDQIAYVAAGAGGLEAVDVSDPAAPALAGAVRFAAPGHCRGLTIRGDLAYVGMGFEWTSGLTIFNVGEPAAMHEIGYVGALGIPVAIDAESDVMFSLYSSQLICLSLADPANPAVLGRISPGGVDMVRSGNIVYVANEDSDSGGIYAYDVSNPHEPVRCGLWQPPGNSNNGMHGLSRHGDYIFATAVHHCRVYVLDFSDPAAPVSVAEWFLPNPRTIYADGHYAYVTCTDQGLVVFALRTPGDLNCDGRVDFDDIDPFVAALSGPTVYTATYPACPQQNGDCNGDGEINFDDIDTFVALLGAP
jgi:hypothetical protein